MGVVVSLDGVLLAGDKAKVSVFDRGFLYGDSVYEVLRTYQGVPFEEDRHLARLLASAERIGMALPAPLRTLSEELWAAHRASGNADSYLRLVCTRGAGPIGLDPALAVDPVRLVIAQPVQPPATSVYLDGASLALVSVRKNLKTAIDPQAKTGNYLNSVLAVAEAKKRGAFEAVLLDHQGTVTEGASSNVFAVLGGTILTPPVEVGILEGITRTVILELARRLNLRLVETPISAGVLLAAEEILISSSIREIVPIVKVDEITIGDGRPGPVFGRLRAEFQRYVTEYTEANRRSG